MSDLEKLTEELMEDSEFRKEYEAIQPEMEIKRKLLDAHIRCNSNNPEINIFIKTTH